jgi:AraC-like DNA-binding protein
MVRIGGCGRRFQHEDNSMADKIEYRVREVKRYIVTRHEERPVKIGDVTEQCQIGTRQIAGEFDNAEVAYQVGYALCKVEHERLGWPMGDERIQYPRHPNETATALVK